MLVLTRKIEEQIHIGDNITISILKLKGNSVRIGIEAPRDIRVLRGELREFNRTIEIEAAGAEASEAATSESEQAEEEATISELEWEVLKKIADRRKPCAPTRRCSSRENIIAPLASVVREKCRTASVAGISASSHA